MLAAIMNKIPVPNQDPYKKHLATVSQGKNVLHSPFVHIVWNLLKRIKRTIHPVFPKDKLVNFIICGTQKGGTSALDAYLREHPEICMADRKEIHFFDNDSKFTAPTPNYRKYHSWFSPKPSHKVIGEATPIYMYWRSAPKRIWEYNPTIKLIVLLRNPIERAYSHWNMEHSRKTDPLSFWDAIQHEQEQGNEASPQQHRVYSYIDRGFYLQQLQRLWSYFPKEQTLILKSEDLKAHPEEILQKVCAFLGVNELQNIHGKNIHSLAYKSKMSKKENTLLKNIFNQEIRNLEQELNWDCSDWLCD